MIRLGLINGKSEPAEGSVDSQSLTEAQKKNSFDEKTGNLKLEKKIWREKSPKRKDTNTSGMEAPNLEGWEGRRRLDRSKRGTRLNMSTSRIVDISKWERWEGKRKDKKERMEAQKKKRCLLQG